MRALIARITESETFASAPAMRTLLLYLWENRGRAVGEYAIGVDALGRPADFDPKSDSTVRVHIARLRAKLKDFYEHAEPDFPLLLSIPRGRHDLVSEYRRTKEQTKEETAGPPPARRNSVPWLAGACTLLLVACLFLIVRNRALTAAAGPNEGMHDLWRTFHINGKPAMIVVPTPLLFFWREPNIYVRDLSISSFPNWRQSKVLSEMAERWGTPEFSQTYVGVMEMTTGVRFLQYLAKRAPGTMLVESRRFAPESMAEQNTIFLGMPRTTAGYLDGVIERMNFYLAEADPAIVRARDGLQPSEFRETSYSADRRIHPAIIAFFPARAEGTRSILIVGRYLTGAATLLTSREGLQAITEALQAAGKPTAWELVVETEVYRDTVLKTRPVAIRPIAASFWSDVRR